ncbi:MAG: T9SS type A sorting domain-containing protein [Chitinophagaceae bacterium]
MRSTSRALTLSAMITVMCSIFQFVKAQPCFVNPRIHKVTADVSWAIKSFMEYLPADWETNPTKKYALLVYLGGTGEMFQQPGGNDYDLCPVLGYSMPWRMNVGHFPNVVLDNSGQPHSYLVVMPFVTQWEQQYQVDPGAMINYALDHYAGRIDVSRIYITGMSRGTDNLMGYITNSVNNAKRVAAVVPVSNCFPANTGTPGYEQQVDNLAGGFVHVWGISCSGDVPCPETHMQNWVNSLNAENPGYGRFTYATFACEGPDLSNHYAWNHAYDPDYKPAPDNKNVYEWMIQFSKSNALPIVLKDWNARLSAGKVLLEWTTSEEFNTKEFVIQRSSANGNMENIFTTPAAGSSDKEIKYQLTDNKPLKGVSLYRLMLRNLDGKEEFYPAKRILVRDGWNDQVIIPNPVIDNLLTIYLNIEKAQQVTIRVFDTNGRLVKQHSAQLKKGITTQEINVGAVQRGVYLVQTTGEDFQTAKKIIIH